MAEARIINGETRVIEVERKKGSAMGFVGRMIGFIVGGFGVLISCILFVTIIGILPAIGLFGMSLGIIYAALGKQKVACPHCGKKSPVIKTAENFTCSKCRQLTVIDWK